MALTISVSLLREALACIPANLPRDEWARIGMAIKSEFPNDEGQALFDEWSATADGYSKQSTLSTWRSIKAGGGVTVGTLLHEAKGRGFALHAHSQSPGEITADRDRRTRERAVRLQTEECSRREAQMTAAKEAADLWGNAAEAGHSSYLVQKAVQPYGVRVDIDGWLLVPVRDAAGELWNVQRISPVGADGRAKKLFLKGGRKADLWHMVGTVEEGGAVLIAEGYATAASLHQATGLPVAVAFDAGNLMKVARALRKAHASAMLVLCGDDDAHSAEQGGSNAGREKALAAAQAVKGVAVFPERLSPGMSDFNDMHQAHGIESVAQIVTGALEAFKAAQKASKLAVLPLESSLDVFDIQDSGVWFVGVEQDGKRRPPEWICSRLDVVALTRDQDGGGWGYLLNFADPLGREKQWAMPARMLASDGGEYRGALLSMGLKVASGTRVRNLLTQYIQTRNPNEYAQCTDRIGWHGHAFVLPHETVGDESERIVFQSDSQMENTFRVKGDAAQWRDRVGSLCAGNSRLVFAVSCAFAGPLLRPAGMESGGFHLRGDSSSGKTTALKLAASVYGGTSFLQRWRTTDNALEAIAAQHSDCVLILDELAQVDPRTAGECAYMLANEQSKARSTRTGLPRARLSWRLLFLSAGELGLADHMAEGMKRARTGQEVRMADIPADAGAGIGMFEHLHDFAGGAAFARHLVREATAVHGAAGRAFIEWAVRRTDSLAKRVRSDIVTLAGEMVPAGASGQVERVGARFALAAAAGELATEAGLTGWAGGEARRAAHACFSAWLEARGGSANGEVTAMLRAVRRFLEIHGEGRFTWWHRAADDHNVKTLQRAGYRRMLNEHGEPIKTDSQHLGEFGNRMPAARGDEVASEYFILPEVFRSEVCQGFDYKAVAAVLLDHQVLMPDKNRKFDTSQRLPGLGRTAWCYRISSNIFELDL